jgi:hypothetical protein
MQICWTVPLAQYWNKYLQSQYTSPWTSRAERSKFFHSCRCFQISRYCFFLLASNGISRTTPRNSSDLENLDNSLQHAHISKNCYSRIRRHIVALQLSTPCMCAIIKFLDWIYFSIKTLIFQLMLPLSDWSPWGVHSSGMLCCIRWQLGTDVSGQPISPTF